MAEQVITTFLWADEAETLLVVPVLHNTTRHYGMLMSTRTQKSHDKPNNPP